jgi:hypothetical protein
MGNKTRFKYLTEEYLNIFKRLYKECNFYKKYLIAALK